MQSFIFLQEKFHDISGKIVSFFRFYNKKCLLLHFLRIMQNLSIPS